MTTYTYPRRNNSYFRYPEKITITDIISSNYIYYSTIKKIAYAIKNYPARRSLYFNDLEPIKKVASKLVNELDSDKTTIIGKIEWNEFNITYQGNTFNILRKTSSDFVWNIYEITKIE